MKNRVSLYVSLVSWVVSAVFFVCTAVPSHAEETLLSVQDTLAPSDTKTYAVAVPAPGVITISTTGWEGTFNWGADYDRLYVYNASNEPIGRNAQSSESDPFLGHMMPDPMTLTTRVGAEGTYTIHLHSGSTWGWKEDKKNQSYSLTVTFTAVTDAYEVNDSLEQATALSIGQQVSAYQWKRTSKADVYGDEDWYRVDITLPGTLTVRLENWVSTLNWGADYDRLYIYRQNGVMFNNTGDEDIYTWMMGESSATSINVGYGGAYYIRLHSGNGTNTEPYTIQVDFQAVDDQFEPNDTLTQGASLSPGVDYTAYQWKSLAQGSVYYGDEDYYAITVTEKSDLTITVNGWQSTYNWGVDYDRVQLFMVSSAGDSTVYDTVTEYHMIGDSFTKTVQAEPGNYVLRLHSGAGWSAEPYTIRLDYKGVGGTAVEETLPAEFAVHNPYPNPFNPATTLSFTLPGQENVAVVVYGYSGQKIRTLIDSSLHAGEHSVTWDGTDDSGRRAGAGVYIFSLTAGGKITTRKATLLK